MIKYKMHYRTSAALEIFAWELEIKPCIIYRTINIYNLISPDENFIFHLLQR